MGKDPICLRAIVQKQEQTREVPPNVGESKSAFPAPTSACIVGLATAALAIERTTQKRDSFIKELSLVFPSTSMSKRDKARLRSSFVLASPEAVDRHRQIMIDA